MKTMKKLVVILAILGFCINLQSNLASADSDDKNVINVISSQEENDSVKNVCQEFIENVFDSVVITEDYSMINPNSKDFIKMLKIRNDNILKNQKEFGLEFNNPKYEFNYENLEVTGNKAYTILKALCTYKDASKDDNSAHEYSYAIELEKINDKWMINKAISNNPWDKKVYSIPKYSKRSLLSDDESIEDNDDIGIQAVKKTQFNTLETEKINNEFKTYREEWKKLIENEKNLKQINRVQVSTRSAGGYHLYRLNRTAVVNYLNRWYNGYNPKYRVLDKGADCANFGSQALCAGGMVQDKVGSYKWWYTSSNPDLKKCTNPMYSWYYANGLYNYLRYNGGNSSRIGVKATPYWMDIESQYYKSNFKPGDIIFEMKYNLFLGRKEATHTMVVHSTGSNCGNVGVSAHSNTRHNESLVSIGLISPGKGGKVMGMLIDGYYK